METNIQNLIKYLRQDVIYNGEKWNVTGLNTEKYLITIKKGEIYKNISPDDVVDLTELRKIFNYIKDNGFVIDKKKYNAYALISDYTIQVISNKDIRKLSFKEILSIKKLI